MPKRPASSASCNSYAEPKRPRAVAQPGYIKVADADNAAAVDNNPPLHNLREAVLNSDNPPNSGSAVVYWMRMEDLRIKDNRAISRASSYAKEHAIPLLVLFVISPQDYRAHDRGPRRIDFMLRNLSLLKESLHELNIPLHTITHLPRRTIPERVVDFMREWGATTLFGNISYEIDELRRDIRTCELASTKQMQGIFIEDKLVVNPGTLTTKDGKQYAVYSPWQRNWIQILNENLDWLQEAPSPEANDAAIRSSSKYGVLFDTPVPEYVDGFVCHDRQRMGEYWPAGTKSAEKMLARFLHTKARQSQIGEVSPFSENVEKSGSGSRIQKYSESRNIASMDTTSRLSPYLASGVISARACIRGVMEYRKSKTVEGGRNTGVGMWIQEIAWRDFYNHVMVAFPRVSMGRPYLEKFSGVKWEVNEEHLQAWKDGKTGVPIVDAAMRQLKQFGWMHNRCRMIVAMYLTKDLMLDWRLGERYFMEELVDGDLASNNGGWQWSASTGTDPQPYFRIFNPASQSEKADPTGDYIRHYVPELAKVKGKDIHAPSKDCAEANGYPKPLVDHKSARDRALRRYKNPGDE